METDNQNRLLVERKGLFVSGTSLVILPGDTGSFNVALRGGTTPVDTEPAGTDIINAYDKDSNLVQVTDEATNILQYTFDALNRRKQLDITRAAGFVGTTKQTWKYDGLSRLGECTDDNEPVPTNDDLLCTYFYDSLSRKIEELRK